MDTHTHTHEAVTEVDGIEELDLKPAPASAKTPTSTTKSAPAEPVKAVPARKTKADREAAKAAEKAAKAKEAARVKKEEQKRLDAAEQRITAALSKSGGSIVEIGTELDGIQKALPRRFKKWAEENLRMAYRTAKNYMYAADAVRDLEKRVGAGNQDTIYALPPTILYAFPTYDEDEKAEVAAMINRGETVRAKPRKPKVEAAKALAPDEERAEGDKTAEDEARLEAAKTNDPDTTEAEALAKAIVAALDLTHARCSKITPASVPSC